MKMCAVVVCVLALTAVTCSKSKVVILNKQTHAGYVGHSTEYRYPEPTWWTYKWRETCYGSVTNEGGPTAFEVRVSAQFSSGHVAEALIDKVNLASGEVGSFLLYGDTLYTHYSGYQFDTTGATPSVTASVSVQWK
jgi:hypothetical protein